MLISNSPAEVLRHAKIILLRPLHGQRYLTPNIFIKDTPRLRNIRTLYVYENPNPLKEGGSLVNTSSKFKLLC